MLTSRFQKTYLSLGRLVYALTVLGCLELSAETPFDALKSKLDQALVENSRKVDSDEKRAKTGTMYLDRLAALRTEFVNQGNLDGVLEVQDEIRRFEKSGGIPTEFSSFEQLAQYQRIYAREVKKIQSEEMVGVLHFYNVYGDELLKREEELVRGGFIDKAVVVRKERVRVKKLIKKLSKGQADPLPMENFEQIGLPEDVFFRPGESETTVPFGNNQKAVKGEAVLSNEAFDGLKAQFDNLLATHWEMVASGEKKLYEQYIKQLRIREFHYQSEGSLDGVQALRAEKKHLEDTGALLMGDSELKHLEIVRNNFLQDVKALKSAARERLLTIYRQYLDDLGELERSLVKKDRIDEAMVVRKERKRAAEVIRKRAKKDLEINVFEVSQDTEE